MEKELKSYEDIIKKAASDKPNENIPNSSLAHAETGIRELFASALPGTKVRIISSEFFEEFWSKLINTIADFLGNNGFLEILLLSKKNKLIDELQTNFGKEKVIVYLAGNAIKDKKEIVPHFVVLEPMGYRFELSDESLKDKIVKGYLNFGDDKGSQELRKFFDGLKEKAQLI